jgi:hypothetical protein
VLDATQGRMKNADSLEKSGNESDEKAKRMNFSGTLCYVHEIIG